MKFEINKKQMQELVDMLPASKIYDIFGEHEVRMLLDLKDTNVENFDYNKLYILRIPNITKSEYFKLTKVTTEIVPNENTRYTFMSLDNSSTHNYPFMTINNLFAFVKSENNYELLEFDSFLEFTNFYVVNP